MIRVLDSAGSTLVEWGRQQQQQRTNKAIKNLSTFLAKATCCQNIVVVLHLTIIYFYVYL